MNFPQCKVQEAYIPWPLCQMDCSLHVDKLPYSGYSHRHMDVCPSASVSQRFFPQHPVFETVHQLMSQGLPTLTFIHVCILVSVPRRLPPPPPHVSLRLFLTSVSASVFENFPSPLYLLIRVCAYALQLVSRRSLKKVSLPAC